MFTGNFVIKIEYKKIGNLFVLYHTEVPVEHQGHGLGYFIAKVGILYDFNFGLFFWFIYFILLKIYIKLDEFVIYNSIYFLYIYIYRYFCIIF